MKQVSRHEITGIGRADGIVRSITCSCGATLKPHEAGDPLVIFDEHMEEERAGDVCCRTCPHFRPSINRRGMCARPRHEKAFAERRHEDDWCDQWRQKLPVPA